MLALSTRVSIGEGFQRNAASSTRPHLFLINKKLLCHPYLSVLRTVVPEETFVRPASESDIIFFVVLINLDDPGHT